MIQRVQSIFLLLSGACLILGIFLPAYTASLPESALTVSAIFRSTTAADAGMQMEITNGLWGFIFGGLLALGAGISFFTIVLFNSRPQQIKLSRLGVLLSALGLAAGFYVVDMVKNDFAVRSNEQFGPALFMPILAMVFLFLASRYIRKDEELVSASNRLR